MPSEKSSLLKQPYEETGTSFFFITIYIVFVAPALFTIGRALLPPTS